MSIKALEALSQGGGWPLLERSGFSFKQDLEAQQKELDAEAEIIAAPFRSPQGRAALDVLLRKTILRVLVPPTLEAGAGTAESVALYAAMRQGQNGLVAVILNAIARTERDPSPPLET